MKKEEKKKKKERKNRTANLEKKKKEKEKKSQSGQKLGWYCLRVPHVCLITKMPLSYELWKLKTAKMCFQFP